MRRSLLRLLLLIYVLFVIYMSLQPPSDGPVFYYDKLAHYLAYFAMAVMALLSFNSTRARFVAFALVLILGALLELGQSFVAGRDMSVYDGLANALGALSGLLLFRLVGDSLARQLRLRN